MGGGGGGGGIEVGNQVYHDLRHYLDHDLAQHLDHDLVDQLSLFLYLEWGTGVDDTGGLMDGPYDVDTSLS